MKSFAHPDFITISFNTNFGIFFSKKIFILFFRAFKFYCANLELGSVLMGDLAIGNDLYFVDLFEILSVALKFLLILWKDKPTMCHNFLVNGIPILVTTKTPGPVADYVWIEGLEGLLCSHGDFLL